MVGGERVGPLSLEELAEAGVGPDTFVWCKGMPDWQKAREDADICRAFRRRLAGLDVATGKPIITAQEVRLQEVVDKDESRETDSRSQIFLSFHSIPEPEESAVDYDSAPLSLLWVSILLTIFCFPFTGWIAIMVSYRCGKAWREATSANNTPEESHRLKVEAHELSRQSRMWAGITFFMGFIFWALLMRLF